MTLTSSISQPVCTITFDGKLDSTNAPQVEEELFEMVASSGCTSFVFNFSRLTYVSSAGLRVLLRMKKTHPDLELQEVQEEVYNILEMTGFTELMTVQKAFRQMSVDGCEIIGKGAKGAVYRYNADTAIKVYFNQNSLPIIKRERELAKKAFVLGIPTAISYDIVRVGTSYGSVFELLNAKSFSQLLGEDPTAFQHYVHEFTTLLKGLHQTQISGDEIPSCRPTIEKWVTEAKLFLTDTEFSKLEGLISSIPTPHTLLHGDYQTNNVLSQNGETLLIDMDTLCYGHPIFDLANIHITYVGFANIAPSYIENFIGLPYATCEKFYKLFLQDYLGTTSPEVLDPIAKSIELLSALRLLRHTVHHPATDAPQEVQNRCAELLRNLLKETDHLTLPE